MSQQLLVILPLLGLSVAGLVLLQARKKKKVPKDFGAFVEALELLPPPQPPPPAAPLPLTGLKFAIKDIFDVKDTVAGFGSLEWKKFHQPATATAPAVQRLLDGGGTCIGRTHMDQFAYSMTGESVSAAYGYQPINPAAPDRLPGGSSTGSAVAVSAALADFALGTDTAGSVRVPAAYCGIFGFRPSHAVVPAKGCIPMAPSLDAIGLFTFDSDLLRKVGHILIGQPFTPPRQPLQFIVAEDCFDIFSASSSSFPHANAILLQSVTGAVEKMFGASSRMLRKMNFGSYLAVHVPSLSSFVKKQQQSGSKAGDSSKEQNGEAATLTGPLALPALREAMAAIQRHEFKAAHGSWIKAEKPPMAADVASRVEAALACVDEETYKTAMKVRDELREALTKLLQNDAVLVLPSAAGLPPLVRSKQAVKDEARKNTLLLTAISSVSGCPQVSIPASTTNGTSTGVPLSVSFMARYGADRFLLDTVALLGPAIHDQAGAASVAAAAAPPRPRKVQPQVNSKQAADAAREKGNEAFKKQDWRLALNFYSEAISLDSTNPANFNNRAIAHINLMNFDQAEADCSAALELNPKNVKALLRRGTAREMLGYYGDALADFKQVLVLEPTNKKAHESTTRLQALAMA